METSKEIKYGNRFLIIVAAIYIFCNICIVFLWRYEGLKDVKVIQDYIKTFAQANITVSLALSTILIAIAALVSRRFDQMVNGKKEFMSLIRTMMLD